MERRGSSGPRERSPTAGSAAAPSRASLQAGAGRGAAGSDLAALRAGEGLRLPGSSEPRQKSAALHERNARLHAAILRIGASRDLDTVLREIVGSARALTGAGRGMIATVDDAGEIEEGRVLNRVVRSEATMSKPIRERMMRVAKVLSLAMVLTGCGGGGGGGAIPRPVDPTPGLRLPSGHGLMAGQIMVAAGVSEEHGNVVVACPPGGAPCVVTVAADGTAVYDHAGGVPIVVAAYDSWGLPRGHGMDAGEIKVAAGASEEQGNVVVTCPPGGSACVVRVSADGTTEYARTGGIPTFMFAHPTFERDNPTAEDLLDHWNQAEPLRTALGLSPVNAADMSIRRNALVALINGAGGDPAETATRLRNVRPEDIEIIGERNGITYGRWKGGPAGTLNIELDWRLAQDFDAEARARMERAGKSWSWRILDDFGTHVLNQPYEYNYESNETGQIETIVIDRGVTANGLVIIVVKNGERGTASAQRVHVERTEDDYEPWFAFIALPQDRSNQTSTMAHEIGHTLGIGARVSPSVRRYINTQDHTFEGPKAMEANDNQPVPFQWSYPGRKPGPNMPVAPGSPGAEVDYGHLNLCTSVMAYCRDRTVTYGPSELDLAYLDDIGYEILDAETAAEPEVYGYGAWGQYSAWGAAVERTIQYESGDPNIVLSQGGIIVEATDTLRASADAFGSAPSATLADTHGGAQGDVTWSGSLIGVDVGQVMLPLVFGDAELRLDLSSLEGTAVFDDLTVHVDGVSSSFRESRLEYDIGVTGNVFSDEDGHVRGGFFGPAHEEMAGVLNDRTATVNLIAGFGGKR